MITWSTFEEDSARLLGEYNENMPVDAPVKLTRTTMAGLIDHTVLKAEATPEQIDLLCQEAREYQFASVCVNTVYAARCAKALADTDVDVCCVVGFPLGASATEAKVAETRYALKAGAREIDMVIHVGGLKAGKFESVYKDIKAVVDACHARGAVCKVIIEAALLTNLEKVEACRLIVEADADFAKTSTGFGPGGATVEDVRLMRYVVGPEMGVKAAGGIRDVEKAIAMVSAGASRIGASAGIAILNGIEE